MTNSTYHSKKFQCHTAVVLSDHDKTVCTTVGKVYDIKVTRDNRYEIINDRGEVHIFDELGSDQYYQKWFNMIDGFEGHELNRYFPELTDHLSPEDLLEVAFYYKTMQCHSGEMNKSKLTIAIKAVEGDKFKAKLVKLFGIDKSISDTIGFDQLYTQVEHLVESATETEE